MEPQSLGKFRLWKPTYPEALVSGGLLYKQTKMMMYGRYKSLKSMTAMNLGMCAADGIPWLGFKTPELGLTVLYLQLEMPELLFHKRLIKMADFWPGDPTRINRHFHIVTWLGKLKIDRPEGLALIAKWVKTVKPDILVIDPVYKVLTGKLTNDDDAQELTDNLDELITNNDLSIILVHHTRQPKEGEDDNTWGSDDMFGSGLFSWWADAIVKVSKRGEKDNKHTLQIRFDIVRHAEDTLNPKEVVVDGNNLRFYVPAEGQIPL